MNNNGTLSLPLRNELRGYTAQQVSPIAGPSSQQFTASFVFYALSRWWKLATLAGLLLAATGAAVIWYTFVPVYESKALINIAGTTPYIAYQQQQESPRFVQTQLELIRSPLMARRVLLQDDVANLPEVLRNPSPMEWLTKEVKVRSVGESELFTLSFQCTSAEACAIIANAYLDQYMNVQAELTKDQNHRTVELLERERTVRMKDLERLQKNLLVVARKVTGKDPTFLKNSDIVVEKNPLAALEDDLASAEVEREVMQARYAALQESIATSKFNVPASAVDRAISGSPEIQKLKSQIERLRALIHETELKAAVGREDEATATLRETLANAEKALQSLRSELAGTVSKDLQESIQYEQQGSLDKLSEEIASKKAMEQLLEKRLAKQRLQMQSLGDQSLELEFARNDLTRSELVFERIADRIAAMQTEMRAPNRINVLDRAMVPKEPIEKNPLKKIAALAGVSFLAPFLLCIVWERRARRLASTQQVNNELTLPVLAEIATLPTRGLVVGRESSNKYKRLLRTFEESIDQLRTSLTLPEHFQNIRVITVTSAVSGEGKTSLASQLAVSLTRTVASPVLLIDADMRRPDLQDLFDIPLGPGLAQVLDGEVSVRDAICTSWNEMLHILPAGVLTKSPHVLMTCERMTALLDSLKNDYRYIIIDAAPLLSASEAFVTAKVADGTLVCTMRDVSRAPQVQIVCDKLRQAGARPLGIVLNGIPNSDYTYYYGTYAYEGQP